MKDLFGFEVSDEARDLLQMLLQPEPAMRPSAEQIKAHPFFTFKPIVPNYLPKSVFDRCLNQQELIEINENYIKLTKQRLINATNQDLQNLPPSDEINYFEQQINMQK